MKKTVLGAKILMFFVVFFFMGMTSLSAQYVEPDEAIALLKGEVTQLEADIPGASDQELINLYFKINYYKFIVWDIQDGAEVGPAIYDNEPKGKAKLHPNDVVTAFNADPSVKQEIIAVVAYVDNLLSD